MAVAAAADAADESRLTYKGTEQDHKQILASVPGPKATNGTPQTNIDKYRTNMDIHRII